MRGPAGGSAAQWAEDAARRARGGLWGRVRLAVGMPSRGQRVAAGQAARRRLGSEAEVATAALLEELAGRGWVLRHDLQVPGRRFNVDHVAVSPCGSALVVPDTKRWRRNWPTQTVRGRLHCGPEDRHGEAEAIARYAVAVAAALGLAADAVWPVLVVHGSHVRGGHVWVPVPGGRVLVLGPELLVPTLAAGPAGRDERAARRLAARVDAVLRPYGQHR